MIEPTRLLAIRHGETSWNVELRIQGHLDIPLNDRGRWQAARLAAALADEPPAIVYSSDLRRARDTAAALADAAGCALHLDAGLRERSFGVFEGLTFAEVEQRWPDDAARWRRRDPDFAPPGGESLRAFHDRATSTVAALAAAHRGAGIAIVAHGGVLDCLYRAAVRIDLQAPRTWQLGNASINRLLHGAEGFVLVGWNDGAHLDAAA